MCRKISAIHFRYSLIATVVNVLCGTVQVSYEAFGELVTKELKPGGKDIVVTNENRKGEVFVWT